MQVYNLILKILKTQLGQIIMYIAIFTTITSVVSSQMASNDSQSFQETKQKISIQDSDQSEASTALSSYLSKTNELIELKDYNTITIQDELYNRNTTNVILIPSGFEQFLVNGQITELLDVYNIPGNTTSDLIKRDIDCFIRIVSSYLSAGIPLTDSLNYTNTTTEKSVTIDLLSQTSLTNDGMYAFFSYIAYIFIALAIVAVSPILLIMNRSEIRNRIFCSSYCNARINFEISLGIALIGLLICIEIGRAHG